MNSHHVPTELEKGTHHNKLPWKSMNEILNHSRNYCQSALARVFPDQWLTKWAAMYHWYPTCFWSLMGCRQRSWLVIHNALSETIHLSINHLHDLGEPYYQRNQKHQDENFHILPCSHSPKPGSYLFLFASHNAIRCQGFFIYSNSWVHFLCITSTTMSIKQPSSNCY